MISAKPTTRSAQTKGDIPVLILSEAEVKTSIDLRQLLDVLAEGFKALSGGKIVNPARPQLDIPQAGYSLAMPAWMAGMHLTVKIVNVFEANIARAIPSHLATIHLFDPETGMPVCVMDGTYVTAVRTSGSAVLSVRELARRDARVATVVGAGVQAGQHLHLLPLVRDFAEIRVASKEFADAQALAARHPGVVAVSDLEAAVRSSDVVCLATHSYQPVISAEWLRPGTHVSSVGVAPPGGELPVELVGRASLFVETRDAFAPTPVGSCELDGIDPQTGTELGEMLLGLRPGRTSADQITVYKAMGVAMEDMVAADLAYREAVRRGLGRAVTL
ncbi:ornithine cyclodeaminase family protein [Mesorhizobium japonicum]|uniref:Ornithine cyclodeaminase n=3 Tax=Phyllobacteriaceae TaxID=69277 RepID=A0A1A5HXM2_RHILI|nr:ornithine cyclodeaminase family protein [Mesorhizobium japonicum]OBP69442.1 ornithine cyclodeaminase [Mesorhizobium loti]QGX81206.1 ornithine cyclodeaminase family protein [Mesorhizobium japonicum R7A]MBE1708856.1 ornithine cyclodeaminase family protein [Mesorhizobium japonicum]MBE1716950.1 ornithine cyclodeaminase family protein [Mesorhizobium japonicum]MUT22294.1 ornithine cyclodeaminase family protein [Mesorhizobium japonicum]